MAAEDPVTFTDEQAAFLRHVRFGELPTRVSPEQLVTSIETDARRDLPEPGPPDVAWFGYYQP